MKDEDIKTILNQSLSKLFEADGYLMEVGSSEQSISHKLAEHLQGEFVKYGLDVDCEYNRNIADVSTKKQIEVLCSLLKNYGLLTKRETELEKEIINRSVYPDIIVHKRGNTEENLLVIEVKKHESSVPFEYDKIKLHKFTSSGNLNYQLGAFLVLNGNENPSIEYFKNGRNQTDKGCFTNSLE